MARVHLDSVGQGGSLGTHDSIWFNSFTKANSNETSQTRVTANLRVMVNTGFKITVSSKGAGPHQINKGKLTNLINSSAAPVSYTVDIGGGPVSLAGGAVTEHHLPTNKTIPVVFEIAGGQDVSAGAYSDTVILTFGMGL